MENLINLTPLQSVIILALNLWIFVIFPIIVIRKINYMTGLLETQIYQNNQENQE